MRSSTPVWLFDLDNTLHDAGPHIMPHIHRSMNEYLAGTLGITTEEAAALRRQYWKRYGTTLSGMMRVHGTDPHHFLRETHRFADLSSMLVFDRPVKAMLRSLPGRKIVFSNAPRHYALEVLNLMGVRSIFDGVYAIEELRFRSKPALQGFLRVIKTERVAPARCIMVEDSPGNLKTAKQLGMKTVLIGRSAKLPAWVDVRIKSVLELPRQLGRL